ncbi:helix-turn-helix domain-containing protein [Mucilaginibacter sp. KACC 22063]|uniref:helix-turn-helix domain-containing protein n=1 Tax=Mucilaginibacter sp. KACC 22063 TaxID=3025666 RepID=UPI00236651CA|nr:helix-turn-helix domain-containing protein [Mucilaginibacter sp. KACC 22063]WDF53411.1 helix-turn-helix domain-containing protein [Mucilaginibacter sp. KACC 22063]
MKHYKSITDLNRENGFALPENPLISLNRCNNTCTIGDRAFTTDFYTIGFKKLKSGVIKYGRTKYDHENGSMSFMKPRQIIEFKDLQFEEDGFLLFIHEDFLNGHFLHSEIEKYSFFDYEINEALHLSPKEEQIIWDLYHKIEIEYNNNPDEYSREIMLAHIDSILKYAQRFYKRQFINRTELSGNTVSKFNNALSIYFKSDQFKKQGLPSVSILASNLNLSVRYLSDLLKQETGKTAIELIHIYLIAEAKNRFTEADYSVSEIAYQLGFENLPYFSRLFKKEVGISPNQYKKQLMN